MSAGATAGRRGWRASLAPLGHRNYALVWGAGLISNVGTWMETVAVGDLVAVRTDQAGWTALVAAAGFLPMGLLGPIGGALADRLDRRRLLVAMTSVQMLAAAALAVLQWLHVAHAEARAMVLAKSVRTSPDRRSPPMATTKESG